MAEKKSLNLLNTKAILQLLKARIEGVEERAYVDSGTVVE